MQALDTGQVVLYVGMFHRLLAAGLCYGPGGSRCDHGLRGLTAVTIRRGVARLAEVFAEMS